MKNDNQHTADNRRREGARDRLQAQLKELQKGNVAYLFNKDPDFVPEDKDFKSKIKYVKAQIAAVENNLPTKTYNT